MKKRLFLGVSTHVAVARKIAEAISRMRGAADKAGMRVSWAPAVNLHVTLKFLGWAGEEVVDAIRDRMRVVVEGKKAFEIGVRGTGAFPDERHAKVLWVGVTDPSGTLRELADATDASMAELGFPKETRPFSAHVTVGRVKEGTGAAEVLTPFAGTDFGNSLIREVVLYESITKPTGSEYIPLGRIPFIAPPYRAERQTRDVEEGSTSEEPNGGPT